MPCLKITGTLVSTKVSIRERKFTVSPSNAPAHAINSASVVLRAVELCFLLCHMTGKLHSPEATLALWLSGSAASGSVALLLLASLLPSLCLGPSGRDRGPQAQKPPKLETTSPPAPISASLRAPLAGNGAPIYRKSPSAAFPWASSLALWLPGSSASGVPVACTDLWSLFQDWRFWQVLRNFWWHLWWR